MSLTSIRLNLFTNRLLESYIQNGILPDEHTIQQNLIDEFQQFYNPANLTFTINQPLWQPANIAYREDGIVSKWNNTQQSAADDTYVIYQDMLEGANLLTQKLYQYINQANLIGTRLNSLVNQIQNLLLLSSDTQGFTYAFFDNFSTNNFVSYMTPFITNVVVDNQNQIVKLNENQNISLPGSTQSSQLVDLSFITDNPQDVSFAVLNQTVNIVALSSAQLSNIFNNSANAWQQSITLAGNGPLVGQLTIRLNPLSAININQININPQMSNPNNQILIQTLYSPDGISYYNIPSANNPQAISNSASINFNTISAMYIRFIITKNIPDFGNTYTIGFQYISFVQVLYEESGDFYSTPISLPSSGVISKIAINPCDIQPDGTSIDYYINYIGDNNKLITLPISPINSINPTATKVLDLDSSVSVTKNIAVSGSSLVWQVEPSGRLSVNLSGLIPTNYILKPSDPNILNTLGLQRSLGPIPIPSSVPFLSPGFNLISSGLWSSYIDVSNPDGSILNLGTDQAFVDGILTNGTSNLSNGLHHIITSHIDQHQVAISQAGDFYFGIPLQFSSIFDFYNNIPSGDISKFTYDQSLGKVIINGNYPNTQTPAIDLNNSFIPFPGNDGTYQSSSNALALISINPVNVPFNAGDSITIHIDSIGKWVNEIQASITSIGGTEIDIDSSMDGNNWVSITSGNLGPNQATTSSMGFIRLPQPVYCSWIRLKFLTGSNIAIINKSLQVFPPSFINDGQIQISPSFLPAQNAWTDLKDSFKQNSNQYIKIFDYFSNNLLLTLPSSGDLASIITPAFYAVVNSSGAVADPYINGLSLISSPTSYDQTTRIDFSFNGTNASNGVKAITFQAHLNSNSSYITPELMSYYVKLI